MGPFCRQSRVVGALCRACQKKSPSNCRNQLLVATRYERIMQANTSWHVCMGHVTRMNESWHTYEWIMSRVWMSHGNIVYVCIISQQ